jgi:hypothetical protein
VLIAMRVPHGGSEPEWESGDLWRLARTIPNVTLVADRGGAEARRFQAVTSGFVVVYSRSGRLLFSGGITPARGHEGASYGQQAIAAALDAEQPSQSLAARVFGCELFEVLQ